MEIPYWFDENWINSDAKAFGVYMALLYLRFKVVVPYEIAKDGTIESVKSEIGSKFAGKEAYEASKAAERFLETFYSHEFSGKADEEKKRSAAALLEIIEGNYYDKFRRACYEYVREEYLRNLRNEDRENLRKFLNSVKLKASEVTASGSVYKPYLDSPTYIHEILTGKYLSELENDERVEAEKRMKTIANAIVYSRVLWFGSIIPAPFLEDEFIDKLGEEIRITERSIPKGEEVEKIKATTGEEKGKEYEGRTPATELLESIVADVLSDLGFVTETNARIRTKKGVMGVDVWGRKQVGNSAFYVYGSCKNWNREVDRSVIDEEFGRTLQLIQIPQLKIFIAKKLTEPARETALADGFLVIELVRKLLQTTPKKFMILFTGI